MNDFEATLPGIMMRTALDFWPVSVGMVVIGIAVGWWGSRRNK